MLGKVPWQDRVDSSGHDPQAYVVLSSDSEFTIVCRVSYNSGGHVQLVRVKNKSETKLPVTEIIFVFDRLVSDGSDAFSFIWIP